MILFNTRNMLTAKVNRLCRFVETEKLLENVTGSYYGLYSREIARVLHSDPEGCNERKAN